MHARRIAAIPRVACVRAPTYTSRFCAHYHGRCPSVRGSGPVHRRPPREAGRNRVDSGSRTEYWRKKSLSSGSSQGPRSDMMPVDRKRRTPGRLNGARGPGSQRSQVPDYAGGMQVAAVMVYSTASTAPPAATGAMPSSRPLIASSSAALGGRQRGEDRGRIGRGPCHR